MADPQAVARIVARLTEPIPAPYRPPPTPRAQWRGLKVGDVLKSLAHGYYLTIRQTDSEGITFDNGLRWRDTDWEAHWSKLPRRRTPRTKKPKTSVDTTSTSE